MKLPSITQIGAEYGRTFQRFPLTMISAVIAIVAAIVLIENEGQWESTIFYNILLSTILALPLLTSLKLAAEGETSGPWSGWTLPAIGVALVVAYAFTVPADLPDAPMFYLFRFFAFVVVGCLLVSFLPFRHKGESHSFWQFNKIVVFRIVLAGAFAAVLFSGLGLALAALDNLFGMDIPGERYGELWILILGLFVVPFILAGVPEDLGELDGTAEYPRSLKVLGQYVLAPLVLVYFVILYAYIAKIVATWSWPQGWVGRLILGFSATGILALFVLEPLREKAGTLWIKKASRWYYVILLPLVVVLFLSLWRRISEYGLTEDRYMGLAIGVWLAFIALYFLISRAKSIKMIPASLCALTLLISVGPWGMFSVSEQSQVNRLRGLLEADSILVDGAVQKAPSPVAEEDEIEISAILSYLNEVHGYSKIEPWFTESLRADSTDSGRRSKSPSYVAELMGVEYSPYGGGGMEKYFSVYIDPQTPISIAGYDRMLRAQLGGPATMVDPVKRPASDAIEATADSMVVRFVVDSATSDSLVIPLHPLIDRLPSSHDDAFELEVPVEDATFEYETAEFKTMVVMLRAHFQRQDSTLMVNWYDALILYSRKSGE